MLSRSTFTDTYSYQAELAFARLRDSTAVPVMVRRNPATPRA